VRTLLKSGLAVILATALCAVPGIAAPASSSSAPLGMVLQADRAQVGANVSSSGATIYEGDRLETDGDGTLRARLGGPQIYLRPNTAAEVHGLSNGFSASLMYGTVAVSSGKGQAFELLANGAKIRPAGDQATVAQVSWINAKELLLTSNHGAIEVSMGDEVSTVEAGNSYRMVIESADSGPQQAGAPHRTGRNRFAIILIAAVSVGTAIGVWRALVSPSAP
jgi:hypothetical protein